VGAARLDRGAPLQACIRGESRTAETQTLSMASNRSQNDGQKKHEKLLFTAVPERRKRQDVGYAAAPLPAVNATSATAGEFANDEDLHPLRRSGGSRCAWLTRLLAGMHLAGQLGVDTPG
jgi:hypothetical protein